MVNQKAAIISPLKITNALNIPRDLMATSLEAFLPNVRLRILLQFELV